MNPIYPYIQVEKVHKENSVLENVFEETPVVKVAALCDMPSGETLSFKVGDKMLVNHVDEYVIDTKNVYFVRLKDIVSVV